MSKNLFKRLITSIILLCLLFLINFSHQHIFIFSILIIGLIICFEANNMFSKFENKKFLKKNLAKDQFNSKFLILNLLTFFYVFFIFCNYSYKIYNFEGSIFFLFIISICFFTDIGGYIFGNIIGGKKLSKISPNKTVSGTVGSFIFSILPIIIIIQFNYLSLEFDLKTIVFCLLVSLVSQLGDLFISFLKRKAKIKDTGQILPGHGGVLDRLHGIIFAVPFSYFLLKII